jgi:2-polyprenyl-6-methoxyphenol hydroxylase-like FAD-dependent oxidoreductase
MRIRPEDMGQGGAIAIENAAVLAAVLPFGTRPDRIPARLDVWQECRQERVKYIRDFTRRNGMDAGNPELPRPTRKIRR